MNANDAALTQLSTAQTGSTVDDTSPNAPANPGFAVVVEGVAGSAVGNSSTPYTLQVSVMDLTAVNQPWAVIKEAEAFNTANGWKLSNGVGPDYEYSQSFPVAIPGWVPGGPLSGHIFQYTASLVTTNAQIVTIVQSDPFVLV
jgi:hypothetical protein